MGKSEEDMFRLDKSAFSVGLLDDESDEKAFWLTKSPIDRLKVVEYLRQVAYGYNPATERLQRVLESAEF